MITTLDANMMASGLIALIVEAWRARRFEVVLSDHLHDELVRTLAQPYFIDRVPPDAISS